MPRITGNEYFFLDESSISTPPASIKLTLDPMRAKATGVRSWIGDLDAVGGKAHDAGRFDPGNLLKLLLTLIERNKEDVAADVAAHDFHDLAAGDVAQARHFNVVAGIQAKAPGVLAVVVQRTGADGKDCCDCDREHCPENLGCGFLGKRTASRGNTLLCAQEWRFLLRVQVEQASVIEIFARRSVGRGVQLILDGGRASSSHQPVSCRGNR